MSKEIPILFSTPMVQAILEGRKTMTRRIIKSQPIIDEDSGFVFDAKYKTSYKNDSLHVPWTEGFIDDHCPYGIAEDVLWVRESWAEPVLFDGAEPDYLYRADGEIQRHSGGKWKPSIHMPKIASRIWMQVTNIRIEQLKDITVPDIVKEGVRYAWDNQMKMYDVSPYFKLGIDNSALSFMPENWKKLNVEDLSKELLKAHWAELWCDINGRESWDANPWLWVVEFKILSTTGKPENI